MKRHYVKHHGQLELCLWGIDKHSLTAELQMSQKHTKLVKRMQQIRDMLTLLGKDCDVIETVEGNSMIVPRRGRLNNQAATPTDQSKGQ